METVPTTPGKTGTLTVIPLRREKKKSAKMG
jgi:hypothetical protein